MSGKVTDNLGRSSGLVKAVAAGREGTVDWDTSNIKTSNFTAEDAKGYFCNTSSSAFTVTLPAGSAGAIVSVADYTRTFQTNNLTISPDGSEKIGGVANDLVLSTEGQSATFVYVDSTEGWINVQNAEDTETGRVVTAYITATGGTIATSGDYKIHTFNSSGTFTVTNEGTCAGSQRLDYVVVAGGGGGGNAGAPDGFSPGGGGAGGYREAVPSPAAWTGSPLATTSGLTAAYQAYPITVGAGGAYTSSPSSFSASGTNSVFSTITSAGGGYGAGKKAAAVGAAGGSGGGGRGGCPGSNSGGAGNTPPVSPPQGNPGGTGGTGTPAPGHGAGAGGGATAAGGNASGTSNGNGGAGATSCITASPVARAGGGGGGSHTHAPSGGTGGAGGGGNGSPNNGSGTAGTANTGGGGGGSGAQSTGGTNGGSGVVIIRYKFQE